MTTCWDQITDGDALYDGAWLYDRDPNGIVPGEKVRDATLTNSDYFGFILDTYLDRQNGFRHQCQQVGRWAHRGDDAARRANTHVACRALDCGHF